MSWGYRTLVRPFLFLQDSEKIHNRTLKALGWVSCHESVCRLVNTFYGGPELPVNLLGLTFPNPIGLAAGMDKPAVALMAWPALGFGFSELGGVTWHPQPGNPAPAAGGFLIHKGEQNRSAWLCVGTGKRGQFLFVIRKADMLFAERSVEVGGVFAEEGANNFEIFGIDRWPDRDKR